MFLKCVLFSVGFQAAGLIFVQGALVTVPPGLNPGDSYRLVFVSDGAIDARSDQINDYDSLIALEAAAVPALNVLGTSWRALASTQFASARGHTETDPVVNGTGFPIYGLDGMRIVDDNADFWDGSLDSAIYLTPTEVDSSLGFTTWTGTGTDGFGIPGSRLGESSPIYGLTGSTDSTWTNFFSGPSAPTRRLYGISGELVVVPEPSSVMLSMVALALLFRPCRRVSR